MNIIASYIHRRERTKKIKISIYVAQENAK